MTDLRFGLLGPLQVWRGSEEVRLGSRRERAVLAILLLRAGAPVPRQEIIDLVWADAAPPSAVNLVHTYIGRLRSRLDPYRAAHGGTDWLIRIGSAYQIQPAHCDIDLLRFRAAVGTARAAAPVDRLRSLQGALGLWRGACLSDQAALAGDPRLRAIDQERTEALMSAAWLGCRLGDVAALLPLLREAAAAEPFNEPLHACLITALATAGIQMQALAEYEGIRARLADQLGVDPGSELRQAHLRVLRQEVGQPRHGATGPRHQPRPALLPTGTAEFTGHAALLDRLEVALTDARGRPRGTVVTIVGRNGVGKSALAVQVAHRVRESFPDGQLYVDLKGVGPAPLDPFRALGRFLRMLGDGDETLPDDTDERAELFRSRIAGRDILVVLDDVRDQAQLAPLLPGSPTASVIVTSRSGQLRVDPAHRVALGVLGDPDALRLLSRVVGADAVEREPAAAGELVRLCDGLPLALRAAGARLTARPYWTIADLVDRMADPDRRLDELVHADLDVRASFGSAYDQLAARPARAFRLLGLLDAPTFTSWLAAALVGVGQPDAERLLETLSDHYLLEVAGTDAAGQTRYRFRELARLWSREKAAETDSREDARRAVTRALTALLELCGDACARARDLPPGGRPSLPWAASSPSVHGRILVDPRSWLRSEATCLLASTLQAAALGMDEMAWRLGELYRDATGLSVPDRQTIPDSWRPGGVRPVSV